jgi:transposase
VWQVLRRLNIHYKRGRQYVHSPDPQYDEKLQAIEVAKGQVQADPQRYVLLYQDELTYYRRPSLAQAYGLAAQDDLRADQGFLPNRKRRIAATLDVISGRVIACQRASFNRRHLLAYFRTLEAAYPDAQQIFLVLDNWPVHFHPDILAALTTSKLLLLRLPTYAPWTNPVEKLWHKLYHDLLHLHSFSFDWSALQAAVDAWLAQFALASHDLLRYCGLPCPP